MNAPVVERRALLRRINRRLAAQGRALRCCCYGSRWFRALGSYYIVNTDRNAIEATHVDVPALAAKLGDLNE